MLPQYQNQIRTSYSWSSELNSPIPVHFSSLIPKMSTFHSCHLLFDHFQFALIHGPNIPGSYAILLFTALNLASITSLIHNLVLFLLWLHPFILSGVISPLISSSILGTYWPVEFIFQCPVFLPFMLFMDTTSVFLPWEPHEQHEKYIVWIHQFKEHKLNITCC